MKKAIPRIVRAPQVLIIVAVLVIGALGTVAFAAQQITTTPVSTKAATSTYATVASAFNNIAITDNAAPAKGNFDNSGNTYSYQDLTGLGCYLGRGTL